ncbi:MAG: creatininase family protein [Caldilineaceae bacterium]
MSAQTEYRYNRLTWPEMNDAIAQQKVVILPTGSTEQHGHHLPLDVDVFLCESICLEAGRRAPDKILVLPPIAYGLNLHHIDFPGTIHIEPDVFIAFCLNITKSVAYHGFKKILLVNGHGSNTPLIDLIARKTVLETGAVCGALGYFPLAMDAFNAVRDRGDGPRRRVRDIALPAPRPRACKWTKPWPTTMCVASMSVPTASTRTLSASTTTGDAGPRPASTATPPRRHCRERQAIFEAAVTGLIGSRG